MRRELLGARFVFVGWSFILQNLSEVNGPNIGFGSSRLPVGVLRFGIKLDISWDLADQIWSSQEKRNDWSGSWIFWNPESAEKAEVLRSEKPVCNCFEEETSVSSADQFPTDFDLRNYLTRENFMFSWIWRFQKDASRDNIACLEGFMIFIQFENDKITKILFKATHKLSFGKGCEELSEHENEPELGKNSNRTKELEQYWIIQTIDHSSGNLPTNFEVKATFGCWDNSIFILRFAVFFSDKFRILLWSKDGSQGSLHWVSLK